MFVQLRLGLKGDKMVSFDGETVTEPAETVLLNLQLKPTSKETEKAA